MEVSLYGERLGLAEWNPDRGTTTFQYSVEARTRNREPSPILMPLEEGVFETSRDHANFHNLPYVLSDSMPDDFGNILLKEWLRQQQLSLDAIDPVERLTYIGNRGMGALEFRPLRHKQSGHRSIRIDELTEVARQVLEGKKVISYRDLDRESLTDILRIGTSVGGARAKALIAIRTDENQNILEIRPGDVTQSGDFSYWLLKMDGVNEKSLGEGQGKGRIEYAYHQMARNAGIDMTDCGLHEENGRFHFLTKRFDRTPTGEKVHMQSLGALAGIDYRLLRAGSYETLFRVMKRLNLPYPQFEQQYRRMLFNVVARNQDDHVKNFSFLMDADGTWRISPAYDLTYQYKPGGTWTDVHQSSIGGKFDHFSRQDLLEFARLFGIKKAQEILEEVIESVSQWPRIAREASIPPDEIKTIGSHLRLREFRSFDH
ncbi:MAG: type II toxin-antitoxin system HipA family toxin [Bacteroidales bacterium]